MYWLTTEDVRSRYRQPAKLMRVRDLTPDTPSPVRIMCIIVEAHPGVALVQDIIGEPAKQGSIRIDVDGQLKIAEKYMLIGDVKMTTGDTGKELRLIVSSSHNINTLDVKLYKEAQESTERVNRSFVG